MTRNPYRTALGALAASMAGLGALIWLLSAVALTGNYAGDPGVLGWSALSGWLLIGAFVFFVAWLVVGALTYRAPAEQSVAVTEPEPASESAGTH